MKGKVLKNEKIQHLIDKTLSGLNDIFGSHLKKIILFGSYAKNQQKADSDIDIMVLTDLSKTELIQHRDIICDLMVNLSLEFDEFVSIIENNIDDFNNYTTYIPFYKNVAREGLEIYAN